MHLSQPDTWIEAENESLVTVVRKGRTMTLEKSAVEAGRVHLLIEPSRRPPTAVCGAAEASRILGNCVENITRWFDDTMTVQRYVGTGLAAQYLTELAHVWTSIDASIAICAAELEDKQLQQLLIKCCFHFNRVADYWERIAKIVAGHGTAELEPLPSTLALQLALQELGKKDVLAFAGALDAFGVPGDAQATAVISSMVRSVCADEKVHGVIEEWAADTRENRISYSSVEAIKDQGYPDTGSHGRKVAERMSPLFAGQVEQSAGRLRALDDSFRLFHMGIGIYFSERRTEFPRRRIDWLQEV